MRFAWLAAVVLATQGVSAHHSISVAYDDSRRTTVEGVVQQFQFVNPHPVVVVQVAREGAAPETWRFEMDSRNELAAIGMNASTLRQGDRIVVIGSLSRTEERQLYIRRLERPADGYAYEQVGSSPRLLRRP